jgi:hypothetical protein
LLQFQIFKVSYKTIWSRGWSRSRSWSRKTYFRLRNTGSHSPILKCKQDFEYKIISNSSYSYSLEVGSVRGSLPVLRIRIQIRIRIRRIQTFLGLPDPDTLQRYGSGSGSVPKSWIRNTGPYTDLPVEEVLPDGPGRALGGRVPAQVLQLLVNPFQRHLYRYSFVNLQTSLTLFIS